MSVAIIASAAYVNAEMAAEFGPLPPAFLPVGNSRLFKLQAELLRSMAAERIVLTLPQSFEPSAHDRRLLASLSIETVFLPDDLSLAESLMLAAIQSLSGDEALTILHGDTLFLGLKQFPLDALSVHCGEHPYPWAAVSTPFKVAPAAEDSCNLVSGLFRFSRAVVLLKCLAEHKSDFLAALNAYAAQVPGFRAVEQEGQWLDLGHLNTYYDSRRALTTERSFNTLSITKDSVCKTSSQPDKIEAEAAWYEALPAGLRAHVPAYLGRVEPSANRPGYSLAYEYLCPLSDLYVFGAFAPAMWKRILSACGETLALMRSWKPDSVEAGWFAHLYEGKAVERYRRFAREAGFDPEQGWTVNGRAFPSPLALIAEMARRVGEPSDADAGVLHGDFCFSNILFDFRRGGLKMIDPRGYAEPGRPGIWGDTRYDLGKLHHSVVGRYDFIVAGYYELDRPAPDALDFRVADCAAQAAIEAQFRDVICHGDAERERLAAAISVLLFFSMLPLHAEDRDRQWALLANGYRVYDRYFGGAA